MKKTLLFSFGALLLAGSAFATSPGNPENVNGMMMPLTGKMYSKNVIVDNSVVRQAKQQKRLHLSNRVPNLIDNPSMEVRPVKRFKTDGGSNLLGYLIYSDDGDMIGSYDATMTRPKQRIADPVAESYSEDGYYVKPVCVWYADDVIHTVAQIIEGGRFLAGECYYKYRTNGSLVSDVQNIHIDAKNFMHISCVVDDKIYGVGTVDGVYSFISAPADNYTDQTQIQPLNAQYGALCYNEDDKYFYGTTYNGDLVKLSSTGEETVIIDSDAMNEAIEDFYPACPTGMVYLPNEKLIYYNAQSGSSSYLYSFNPVTNELKYLFTYDNGVEFSMMFTTDKSLSPLVPGLVEDLTASFEEASKNGSVSFTMPKTTRQGDELKSELQWNLLLDGNLYNLGKAKPGEKVTCNMVDLEDGQHKISVFASDSREGGLKTISVFVGNDTPAAPENVVLDADGNLTWNAVTTGVHGGYVDASAIMYQIYMNGEVSGAPVASTTAKIDIKAGTPLEKIVVGVTAICNGLESAMAKSEGLPLGDPLTMPVTLEPTYDQKDLFMMRSGNAAEWEFSYSSIDFENCFTVKFDYEGNDLDAWLILPPVRLESDEFIDFRFDALALGDWVQEELEFCIGTSPDVEKMKVIKGGIHPEVNAYKTNTIPFKVDTEGTYYLAVHGVSEMYGDGMEVRNFRVDKSRFSSESPEAVTSLEAVAPTDGSLYANVTFNLPTKSIAGDEYSADTTLKARVECNTFSWIEGKPGEKVTVRVATSQSTLSSLNKITVVPYYGEQVGISSDINVFTGQDYPGIVDSSTKKMYVNADGISVTLKWDPVTEGGSGLYLDPSGVRYKILEGYSGSFGITWFEIDEVSGTEYTYSVPEGTEQNFVYIGVMATNIAGDAENGAVFTPILGEPDQLPQVCDASKGTASDPFAGTIMFGFGSDVAWGYIMYDDLVEQTSGLDPSITGLEGGSIILGQPKAAGDVTGMISGPMFSTLGVNDACYELTAYTGAIGCTYNLYGQAAGMESQELILIGTLESTGGWTTQSFRLPEELQNNGCVSVRIGVEATAGSQLALIRGFRAYAGSTGVELMSNVKSAVIKAGKGKISFCGFENDLVEISRIDGSKVSVVRIKSADETVSVEKGIYIVKANGKKAKLLVK